MTNHPQLSSSDSPKNERIWRYLDFTKFVSLLTTKAIYFARADLLGDPFEGSFPEKDLANMDLFKDFLPSRVSRNKNRLAETGKELREVVRELRKIIYVNCWHINEQESAAMWKLYLKSDEGVAIQSTSSRLRKCLSLAREIKLINVNYVNYDEECFRDTEGFGPLLVPFANKRKSFEHERELRAIFCDSSKLNQSHWDALKGKWIDNTPFDAGHYVKVDLQTLIDRVFVSPNSPEWFNKLVQSVTKKYRVDKKVIQSQLSKKPLW